MTPRIVVTHGSILTRAYAAYSDRLRDAGAEPIEVGPGDAIPERADALCLAGGPDVLWTRYDSERRGSEEPDIPRDELELDTLLPWAFRERVPVLGVCRGIQTLNVYLGGTLRQDIGESHRAKGDNVVSHPVRIAAASRLAAACGTSLVSNSRHHQALDRLGEGLRAVGWVDDLVEAVELPGDHWVVGVQWHPERVQDHVANNGLGIFEAFVREAERVPAR